MLGYDGPILLNVITDGEAALSPMVLLGKGLDECIMYEEGSEKKRRALIK